MKTGITASTHPLRALIRDSSWVWAAHIASMALAMLASIIVARALQAEGRGIYAWFTTLVAVGGQFALLGLDLTNRRIASQTPENVPALIRLSLGLCTLSSLAIALLIALTGWLFSDIARHSLWLLLSLLSLPPFTITIALGMILNARQRLGFIVGYFVLPRAITLAFVILAWQLNSLNVTSALTINIIAQTATFIFTLWHLSEDWPPIPGAATWKTLLKSSLWRYTSVAYVAGLAQLLMQKVDILMLGQMLGPIPTGHYSVAAIITDILIGPVSIVAVMLSTRLKNPTHPFPPSLFRRVLILGTGLLVFVGFITVILAPWIIRLLFGPNFGPAATALQWLTPASVALGLFMVLQQTVAALSPGRHIALAPLVGSVSNILINLWAIPAYGIPGACLASLVSYTAAAAFAGYILKKHHKL